MAIKDIKELHVGRMKIDLTGPQGNAYYLMGLAQDLCKKLGRKSEPILKDMQSGDYEHLLKVFDKHFGDFVDLYR